MQIIIATHRDEAILIEISDTATIHDLKKKISMELPNFKVIDQKLKLKSKILFDSDTVLNCDIQKNSVINLLTLKRKNIVFLKMMDNVVHELKVDNFASNVYAIKKQISRTLHIPVEYLQLYINTTELHNNDILSDKMIGPETTLNLILNLNIRLQLCRGCPGAYQDISIPINSKILQIKQHVETLYNIPIDRQTLFFKYQKLDVDENTLMDYKIVNDSYIKIKTDYFEIFIETTFFKPNKISLRVFPSETVKQVKDKIESYMKWNSIEQKLFWNHSILHDDDILREKGITAGSHLYLFVLPDLLYLSIQAEPGQNIKIVCETTETVGQLMKKIEKTTKIPLVNQVLYSNSKMWCNGQSCLLMKLNLNKTSNIILKREEDFEIYVKPLTGTVITLPVNKSHTVEDIMCKIEESQGHPTDKLWISCAGRKLEDGRSIESYKIKAGATLFLLGRLSSCSI